MSKIGNEPKIEQKEKVHETSRPHTFRVALYIWSICVLGVASLCVLTINYPPRMTLAFAGFLLFAFLTGFYRMRIPFQSEKSLTALLILSALLCLGPAEACWVATLSGLVRGTFRVAQRALDRSLFNKSILCVSAASAGSAYTLFGWNRWPFTLGHSLLSACGAAAALWLAYTGLAAGMKAVRERSSFSADFGLVLRPLLPAAPVVTAFSVLLTLLAVKFGPLALVIFLVILGGLHLSMIVYPVRTRVPVR